MGGALLPALVDKPLSFLLPSLPSRVVAHSIFTAGLILIIGGYLARRANHFGYWIAYTTGYLSHLGADLIDSMFTRERRSYSSFGRLSLITITPTPLGSYSP